MTDDAPTLDDLRAIARVAKLQFRSEAGLAVLELQSFAEGLAKALGEISRDEAVDALKRRAAELFEDLR
jgi:hypothetical protein